MSWKVTYKNIYGDVEAEEFGTREEAEARYDELLQRCSLYWDTLRAGEDIPDTCDIDWVDEPEEVNEDGSSACALGAVPTGTVTPKRKTMKMKENEEFWIDVVSPEYRGAPAPKFDPKAINEPRIPDGMRYKEYSWSEDSDGVILDWVTQEIYTPEDREAFKVEVRRALKENGFKGKVQVNLNVRGEDDIETFFIDMGKNEAKVVIKVHERDENAYAQRQAKFGKMSCDELLALLKDAGDYFNRAVAGTLDAKDKGGLHELGVAIKDMANGRTLFGIGDTLDELSGLV